MIITLLTRFCSLVLRSRTGLELALAASTMLVSCSLSIALLRSTFSLLCCWAPSGPAGAPFRDTGVSIACFCFFVFCTESLAAAVARLNSSSMFVKTSCKGKGEIETIFTCKTGHHRVLHIHCSIARLRACWRCSSTGNPH